MCFRTTSRFYWVLRVALRCSSSQQGFVLLTAILFGFLFLSWVLAFITLNSSLAVVRVNKDLRFNPYHRAGSILAARTFAIALAQPSLQSLISSCSSSGGTTYTCINAGSSQGSFMSQYACTGGTATLSDLLGSGFSLVGSATTTCIRDLRVVLGSNGGNSSMTVTTSTGSTGNGFVRLTSTMLLQQPAIPPISLIPANGCSSNPRTLQGGTYTGNISAYCGSSYQASAGSVCPPSSSYPNYVQNVTINGCLTTVATAPPSFCFTAADPSCPTFAAPPVTLVPGTGSQSSTVDIVASANLSNLRNSSSGPCLSTSTATSLACQPVSQNLLSSQLKVAFIGGSDSGTISLSSSSPPTISGALIIVSCRSLNIPSNLARFASANSGIIALISGRFSDSSNPSRLQPCPASSPPSYTVNLPNNATQNLAIIAPFSEVTLQGGSGSQFTGAILAGRVKVNGNTAITLTGTDLSAGGSSTANLVDILFQSRLRQGLKRMGVSAWQVPE